MAALLAAGCGGSGGDEAAGKRVAEATAKTERLRNARFVLRVVTEPSKQADLEFQGDLDFRTDLARAEIVYHAFPEAEPGSRVHAVFSGVDTYYRTPGQRRWHKENTADADFGGTTGVAESLDYLGAVTGGAEDEGRAEEGGVPVTRYATTVDLRKVAEQVPPDQRARYDAQIERFATTELPLTVWIDDGGVLRRLRYELELDDLGVGGAPEGEKLVADLRLFAFGQAASVKVPPRRLVAGQ